MRGSEQGAQTRLSLRAAVADDIAWLVELRAIVLRDDLERLGRFDEIRVRQRMRDAFDPASTRIIVVDGADAGSIAIRQAEDARWIEHFYLPPSLQGRGIGSRVLAASLDDAADYRLNVLQGSMARRLYERHGFVFETEDEVDVFLARPASSHVSGGVRSASSMVR